MLNAAHVELCVKKYFDELDRMMDVKLKIVHILHLHFSLLMVSIYQTIDSNAMHEIVYHLQKIV